MDKTAECWRLLFNLVDDFREAANKYNHDSHSEVANVTVGQMKILKAIAYFMEEKTSGGVMLKTLAEKVHLTPGATSLIVDSLVKAGMLERKPSEVDRRAVKIGLSHEGRRKVSGYTNFFKIHTEKFLAELSSEDREKFIEIMKRFHNKINEENEK